MISFLRRYVAGLTSVEPGYRRIRVAPRPGGGITWTRSHHDAPHGRIAVEWQLEGGNGAVTSTVPEGSTCEVSLPDGQTFEVGAGSHIHSRQQSPRGESNP